MPKNLKPQFYCNPMYLFYNLERKCSVVFEVPFNITVIGLFLLNNNKFQFTHQ
jgi:hypothetical protein